MEPTTTPTPGAKPEYTIPTTIKLGGIEYSVMETPELKNLVTNVAQREKAKLYTVIQETNKKVEQLRNVEIDMAPPAVTPDDIRSMVQAAVSDVVKPLIEANNRVQAETLETYRQRVIRENAGTCIPAYVTGNTREEIDASLAKSIEVRASFPSANVPAPPGGERAPIVDPVLQQQMNQENNGGSVAPAYVPPAPETDPVKIAEANRLMQEQQQRMQQNGSNAGAAATPTNPPASVAPPAAPQSSPTGELPNRQTPDLSTVLPDVSKMSLDEYKRQRGQLLENLKNAGV